MTDVSGTRLKLVKSYKDLLVWQLAMDALIMCYRLTEGFPSADQFGLSFQIRKSAVSIPSNIAEGYQRRSRKVYFNHISIALGSQGELETQLEAARRLGFCSEADVKPVVETVEEVGRLLFGLARSLTRGDGTGTRAFSYHVPDA
jgi:four helix bundle protein